MKGYELTATQAAVMLDKKEISSKELVTACIERIKTTDDSINAFLHVDEQSATQQAMLSDERRAKGESLGVFDGVPYALKDNICTKDIPTTCASRILENFVPPYSATVYDRLNAAGGVMVGKTNMDEFAMGSSCENSYFKATRNPHDTSKVPGGSSGGSAACVAALQVPLSLGSDTGGSIRQPAGFCGVVGLKPTYGAVSRYGLVAFASSLDQIGPFGRTVDDVAMMCDIIYGHDKHDATSLSQEFSRDKRGLKGLKVALPKEYFGEGINPDIKKAVLFAVEAMRKEGAIVSEISLPTTDYALSAYYIVSSAEASSNLARFDGVKYGYRAQADTLNDMYKKSRSEGFGSEVKRRILLGTYVLSSGYYDAYYKRAKLLQRQMCEEYNTALQQYDILLTPISPTTAFGIGEKTESPTEMYAADICTVPLNLTGLPGLCVPCGMSGGLPVGMQFIGRHGSDFELLSVAKEYERLVGGFVKAEV